MIPGFLGIFIPLLPGVPLMFVVAFVFALIDRFIHLTARELFILAFIAFAAFVIDHASGLIGASFGGASRKALIAGVIGFVIGMALFPPFGSLIGLYLGIFIVEMVYSVDIKKATRAASSSTIGSLIGIIINAMLGVLFMILFVWFTLH